VPEAYASTCKYLGPHEVPCDPSALPGSDAGADASDEGGAGDAGAGCTKQVMGCDDFDDLDVAIRGLHPTDVWITRLRADLPIAALSTDLRLEAAPSQTAVPSFHQTTSFTDPSFDPCGSVRSARSSFEPPPPTSQPADDGACACRSARMQDAAGTAVVVALGALGASLAMRRRRRS
jgi:MYXO-CTERM domain-containing protein